MVNIFYILDPAFTIFLIALVYYLLYSFLVKLLVDKEKIKKVNQKAKDIQLQIDKASKEKDEKKLVELSKEYEKLIPEFFGISLMQLKPIIPLIPVLIFLSHWLKETYAFFTIKLPFSLPIFIQNLEKFPNWRDTFGPVGWFWIAVFSISISISLVQHFINNFKKFKEKITTNSVFKNLDLKKEVVENAPKK